MDIVEEVVIEGDDIDVEIEDDAQVARKKAKTLPKAPVKEKLVRLPVGRIKQIIKLDPEVTMTSNESVFLITAATELFIETLSKEAKSVLAETKMKTIQKKHVLDAIQRSEALIFLDGVID